MVAVPIYVADNHRVTLGWTNTLANFH